MNRLLACIVVAALGASSGEARKPRCTFRAHVAANTHDSGVFSSRVRSAVTGQNITIEKVPTISEWDIASFRAYPAQDGTFGVLFQLNEHGKLALDTLSVDRRGTMLYVFVNGRLASELQIDRRVPDGKLFVASGLTAADIALMKNDWPISGVAANRR